MSGFKHRDIKPQSTRGYTEKKNENTGPPFHHHELEKFRRGWTTGESVRCETRNDEPRTMGLLLELQEIKRLPIVKPPLDFFGLEVPQSLYVENWTDASGNLCAA